MRAWQLDKIRRALHSYCAFKSENAKAYSLRQILDDMPAGFGPDLELESFRRFYVGETKSFRQVEKLDDVISFLGEVEMLKPGDLAEEEAAFSEGVALHNAIANVSKDAASAHERLAGRYVAALERGPLERLILTLVIEPPGTLLWVEEEFVREAVPNSRLKDDGSLRIIRKGCGISVSFVPTLNFFVRGADRMDLVHYVRIPPREEGENLVFMRCGAVDAKGRGDHGEVIIFEPDSDGKAVAVEVRLQAPQPTVTDVAAILGSRARVR